MNRREFLTSVATKAAGGAVIGLAAGCSLAQHPPSRRPRRLLPRIRHCPKSKWQMATSGRCAGHDLWRRSCFCRRRQGDDRRQFVIEPRAGELAPGTQVLDVVSQGAVPSATTASYYYVGKSPVTAFGWHSPLASMPSSRMPGSMKAAAWRMQEFYASKFNVIQFPAGNTGVQMVAGSAKEINTPSRPQRPQDARIPGWAVQVIAKLGRHRAGAARRRIFQACNRRYRLRRVGGTVRRRNWASAR